MSISAVLFLTFAILLLLNVPIALCLGISSIAAMAYGGLSLSMIPVNVYSGIGKFLLMAIPFFVLAGNIMEKAGISKRLIDFASTLVGHKNGGLAIVCAIVSCFFAAISGAGPATVAALGVIIIPAMIKAGYSDSMASALMATSGSIGIIIPPSISFVVYGAVAGVSISKMFMAGIIPGLIMGAALIIMPIIILGGIYSGVFTPTEAAAVSVVYGLFVGLVIYREIRFKELKEVLVQSIEQSAGIMFILASATLFAWVCTTSGISRAAAGLLQTVCRNQFEFLLVVNIILLIAGCFIDANSAMYIFIPIMLPVVKALGYDPIAFGVVMTVNLAIGLSTPPVGVDLFVACQIGKVNMKQISKAVVPLLIAQLVVLFLITYVPSIITWLPAVLS